MAAAGVVLKKLIELSSEVEVTNNVMVTALVLSKTEPNIFRGGKDAHEWRGVITYTVRDSKPHLVNCKYWGSKEKVEEYHRMLQIGDVINIICPRVVPHSLQPDRFQPLSTLPYTLVLNEGQSYLQKRGGGATNAHHGLQNLLRLSHKPLCSVLNLMDVRSSASAATDLPPQGQMGQFVDLLVAIAALRPAKEVRSSRTGQLLHCLEMIVCDQSVSDGDGMVLTIWNTNWIQRAQNYWQPRCTVLHLIDVRVSHSDFYKSATLSLTGRTLVYENPHGSETQVLLEFAASLPSKNFEMFVQSGSGNLPSPDQIIDQMTVKQLYARAEGNLKNSTAGAEQFTAVLYAIVTKFDIDGQSVITSRKCKSCQRLMLRNQIWCATDQCQLAFSLNYSGDKFEDFFNINLHLSDHTATLVETRLTGSVAERLLGVRVEEYTHWTAEQKEQLKWRHLMQHCVAKVLVKKVNTVRRNLAVIIVDMQPIQLEELAQKIIVF